MIKDRSMLLRTALRKKMPKLTALSPPRSALAIAPCRACAEPEGKGPPVLRDTETEQLLREYTRPILRAAGLEKQNIQIVIINDKRLQRLCRGRPPHFRQLWRADAVGNPEPDHRSAGA